MPLIVPKPSPSHVVKVLDLAYLSAYYLRGVFDDVNTMPRPVGSGVDANYKGFGAGDLNLIGLEGLGPDDDDVTGLWGMAKVVDRLYSTVLGMKTYSQVAPLVGPVELLRAKLADNELGVALVAPTINALDGMLNGVYDGVYGLIDYIRYVNTSGIAVASPGQVGAVLLGRTAQFIAGILGSQFNNLDIYSSAMPSATNSGSLASNTETESFTSVVSTIPGKSGARVLKVTATYSKVGAIDLPDFLVGVTLRSLADGSERTGLVACAPVEATEPTSGVPITYTLEVYNNNGEMADHFETVVGVTSFEFVSVGATASGITVRGEPFLYGDSQWPGDGYSL